MEEHTKHTLSILDHSHFVFAHSFDILSESHLEGRDVNGDPIPANPWGIPLLGYGYGTKIVPMGMDMGQNLHPLGKRV